MDSLESLLHSRPASPSTPSPSERRRFQSESPSEDHALTMGRYRALSRTPNTPINLDFSAPPSPESSGFLPPKEHVPPSPLSINTPISAFSAHSPLATLSPLAHLGLVQSQRNALRSELKSQTATNELQRQSLSSLRKLSLRLAVRASVKDAHIERDLETIGQLRKAEYVKSREYASAVVQLDNSLALHERVMNELVEIVRSSSEESTSNNVIHQIRSCPALPFTPLSPPPSPQNGLKGALQVEKPAIAGPSRLSTSRKDRIKVEQESQQILLACRSRYEELEREISHARSRSALLHHSTLSLQDTVDYQARKLNELEAHKEKLQQELQMVSSKLGVSQQSESKWRAVVEAKASELGLLKKEIEANKAQIVSLSNSKSITGLELQQTRAKLTDSVSSWKKMSTLVRAKTEEIARLSKKNSETESQRQGLEEVRRALESEVSRHQSLIETMQNEKVKNALDLRNTQSSLDASTKSHEELRESLESKITEMEALEVKLRQNDGRISVLEDLVAMHEETIRHSTLDHTNLEQSRSSLEESLHEAVEARKTIDGELHELQSSYAEMKERDHNNQKANEKIAKELLVLQQANASIEEKLQIAEDEMRAKVSVEEGLQEQIAALTNLNSGLHDQLSMSQSSLDNVKSSQKSLETEIDRLTGALDVLKKSEIELTDRLEIMTSKQSQLEDLNKNLIETNATLESQFSIVQSELAAITLSEKDIHQKLTESQSLGVQYKEDLNAALTKISELTEANEALEKKLQSSEGAKSLLEDEIRSINITLEDIARTKKALGEQLEVSESTNTRLLQDLSTTQQDLKAAILSGEQLNQQLLIFQESDARLTEDLSTVKRDLKQMFQSETLLKEKVRALETAAAANESDLRTAQLYQKTAELNRDGQAAVSQNLLEQIQDLKSSNLTIGAELTTARRALLETEHSKQSTHAKISDLSQAKNTLESDLAHLRTRLNAVEQSETSLTLSLETAQAEKTALEQTLHSHLLASDAAIARLEQELLTNHSRLASAEAAAADVQVQLDAALGNMGDKERELVSQLKMSNETLRKVEGALVDAQAKLGASRASEAALKMQFKNFQDGKAKIEEGFQKELRELEGLAVKLKGELSGTQKRLDAAEVRARGLEEELEAARLRGEVKEREMREQIIKLAGEKTEVEGEVGWIRALLGESEKAEEVLLGQIEELKKESSEVEQQLRAYLEAAQNTARITEDELIVKRTRLEMTEETNRTLQAHNLELTTAKSQSEQTLHDLNTTTQTLRAALQTAESQLTDATTTKTTLISQLQTSEARATKLAADLTTLQQALTASTTRTTELQTLLTTTTAAQAATAAKLLAAETLHTTLLRKSHADLQATRQDQAQIRAFTSEISTLRTELQAAEAALAASTSTTEQDTAARANQEREIVLLREAHTDAVAQLALAEQHAADLHAERAALHARVREQKGEIRRLRAEAGKVATMTGSYRLAGSFPRAESPHLPSPLPPTRVTHVGRTASGFWGREIGNGSLMGRRGKRVVSTGNLCAVARENEGEREREKERVGGVDLWQARLKEQFKRHTRPFSRGSVFSNTSATSSSKENEVPSPQKGKGKEPSKGSFRRNTLHKKTPTLKGSPEKRDISSESSLAATTRRWWGSARPKTATL